MAPLMEEVGTQIMDMLRSQDDVLKQHSKQLTYLTEQVSSLTERVEKIDYNAQMIMEQLAQTVKVLKDATVDNTRKA